VISNVLYSARVLRNAWRVRSDLDSPLLAQGRARRGDGGAVAGGVEHAGGGGAAEGRLGDPLEWCWGAERPGGDNRVTTLANTTHNTLVTWTQRCPVDSTNTAEPPSSTLAGQPTLFCSCAIE